jgi:hypothetical protein
VAGLPARDAGIPVGGPESPIRGACVQTGAPAALSRLLLADGRVTEALAVTDEPAGILASKGTWAWAADLAPARVEALVAAGRTAEAADLVRVFATADRGRDAPATKAALLSCRPALAEGRGDRAQAGALFGRAAAAWRVLPRPYETLLAREREARWPACRRPHQPSSGRGTGPVPEDRGQPRGLADAQARRLLQDCPGSARPRGWHRLEVR